MSDKKFGSLKDKLDPLAKETPNIHATATHNAEAGRTTPTKEVKPKAPVADRNAQYLLKMRREQRRQLTKLAAMEDMTIRGFILHALQDKGLDVNEEDMIDLRRTAE